MKLISALAVAFVLGSTAAIAAQTTATAPASATPSSSGSSATATAAKPTTASCKKQAAAKNLTGADKTQFVKDCKAGKASS
jgi:hypothetical protein